jgi:hypothetical protein
MENNKHLFVKFDEKNKIYIFTNIILKNAHFPNNIYQIILPNSDFRIKEIINNYEHGLVPYTHSYLNKDNGRYTNIFRYVPITDLKKFVQSFLTCNELLSNIVNFKHHSLSIIDMFKMKRTDFSLD